MDTMNNINHREALGYWLNEHKLVGHGAEIGCAFGGYARTVLGQWKGKKYFMVDPWKRQSSEVYREKTDGVNYDRWYEECLELSKQDPRVALIRAMSVDAAPLIPDGSLDFVYIDGNHAGRNVLEDMDAWWPKVKNGGLFSGHDCYDATDSGHFCEVQTAVTRWMKEHQLTFYVTPCTSWWHRKA